MSEAVIRTRPLGQRHRVPPARFPVPMARLTSGTNAVVARSIRSGTSRATKEPIRSRSSASILASTGCALASRTRVANRSTTDCGPIGKVILAGSALSRPVRVPGGQQHGLLLDVADLAVHRGPVSPRAPGRRPGPMCAAPRTGRSSAMVASRNGSSEAAGAGGTPGSTREAAVRTESPPAVPPGSVVAVVS